MTAPGDLVVLRAGGPLLVVGDVGATHVEVLWFAGALLQRAVVRLEAIRPVRRDELAEWVTKEKGAQA